MLLGCLRFLVFIWRLGKNEKTFWDLATFTLHLTMYLIHCGSGLLDFAFFPHQRILLSFIIIFIAHWLKSCNFFFLAKGSKSTLVDTISVARQIVIYLVFRYRRVLSDLSTWGYPYLPITCPSQGHTLSILFVSFQEF